MTVHARYIPAAVALAFASAALAQTPTTPTYDRQAKEAEEQRIEAQAKSAKARCNQMEGNAEDICEAQAKAEEKVAKAELDAKYDPSPRNQRRASAMKAEGQYEVAKQRCQDAAERIECRKAARQSYDQALADVDRQFPQGRSAATGSTVRGAP